MMLYYKTMISSSEELKPYNWITLFPNQLFIFRKILMGFENRYVIGEKALLRYTCNTNKTFSQPEPFVALTIKTIHMYMCGVAY